jgi:hypothetical protein
VAQESSFGARNIRGDYEADVVVLGSGCVGLHVLGTDRTAAPAAAPVVKEISPAFFSPRTALPGHDCFLPELFWQPRSRTRPPLGEAYANSDAIAPAKARPCRGYWFP